MTNIIFTIEDVKEFLREQNSKEWTGYIYDDDNHGKKIATTNDFVYPKYPTIALELVNEHTRNSFIDMFITNFSFITYTDSSKFMENGSFLSVDKVLTKKWQQFLLNKYKEKYAKLLFDWSIENMSAIETETKEKIHNFTTEEKAKAKKKINQYNDMAKEAMKYLSNEDLQAIEESVNL